MLIIGIFKSLVGSSNEVGDHLLLTELGIACDLPLVGGERDQVGAGLQVDEGGV
jgi:hypothetical protein